MITRVLFKFREQSTRKLYNKKHKRWNKLPTNITNLLLRRKLDMLFGKHIERSADEIVKLQQEFLNYKYEG